MDGEDDLPTLRVSGELARPAPPSKTRRRHGMPSRLAGGVEKLSTFAGRAGASSRSAKLGERLMRVQPRFWTLVLFRTACSLFAQAEESTTLPAVTRIWSCPARALSRWHASARRPDRGRSASGGAAHLGLQGRLDIVFSRDEGQTWTRPTVVNDSPVDDRNLAFRQAQDGTLVVAFWRPRAATMSRRCNALAGQAGQYLGHAPPMAVRPGPTRPRSMSQTSAMAAPLARS